MKDAINKFYEFLDRPLFPLSRLVLALLVIPLAFGMFQPLWRISMKAPQYPKGLYMDIYAHRVEGGHGGLDIKEINTLNHYIGMHKIDRAELTDLDWIPFALGLLIVLTLRCAAIGNVRALIDLVVIAGYISLFAFGRFVYKLWVYGHELDPTAPIKIKPFTPAIFGDKQIANFSTNSYPQLGSILIGVFMTGLLGVVAWHLIAVRRAAVRAARLAAAAAPAAAGVGAARAHAKTVVRRPDSRRAAAVGAGRPATATSGVAIGRATAACRSAIAAARSAATRARLPASRRPCAQRSIARDSVAWAVSSGAIRRITARSAGSAAAWACHIAIAAPKVSRTQPSAALARASPSSVGTPVGVRAGAVAATPWRAARRAHSRACTISSAAARRQASIKSRGAPWAASAWPTSPKACTDAASRRACSAKYAPTGLAGTWCASWLW